MSTPSRRFDFVRSKMTNPGTRAVLAGAGCMLCGWLLLEMIPQLEIEAFGRGAAWLASLFTGVPVVRVTEGWMLPAAGRAVVVTPACSATGYFLMLAALVGWHFARRGHSLARVMGVGCGTAFLLAVLVNSLRIVAVIAAHRWVIPLWPDAYGPFLHMATGVAVFLPALIAINLLFESHGRLRHRTSS